ncbi:MAG: beta-galactosidase, partial [Candidatus Micrarchaeaceae archaeon]
MKTYSVQVLDSNKKIYSNHIKLGGFDPKGNKIGFTNYFMTLNGKPFFGISGEFHYSRYDENLWEDEIIKMKNCGINIISTYVFWIHHEEQEGKFNWTGNKNLRHFVELCDKHKLYMIIRIGPFSHGEVRNGGLPDWLFGQTFEVRSNNEDYLKYVRKFYSEISNQIQGLLFKDGGPIIGVQIENEYMHAGAPWELTTGVSNDWVTAGHDGESHMKILKNIAVEEGIISPIYTCTAWGGAAAPTDEMLPMWGGYAFWPWIFYGDVKEHPATPEYIFRDYHNNENRHLYNFEPQYNPEDYPYACCEIGGGMTVFYKYRFIVPPESVKAMSIVKIASGANFIGYYMFHGGSNFKGHINVYLNEHAVPKISYDFQAPLGEFGQVRESYKHLKLLHYFLKDFGEELCEMKTILPEDADKIVPDDVKTLRYALRVKGNSGFLFINNYQ